MQGRLKEFMYLHIGSSIAIPTEDIIGIFDIDNTSTARATKEYLKSAEDEGMIITVSDDLPKSLVVCCPQGSWQRVYISPLAPSTLMGRMGSHRIY